MRLSILLLLLAFALPATAKDIRTVVLAGGCFWCVESDFDKVEGVLDTVSGFSGGHVDNPTYRQVVREDTGHLEVVQITYDSEVIGFQELVDLFIRSIDPTDPGGQFCDRGHSYSTAIFVANEEERTAAQTTIQNAGAVLDAPVVTRILDASTFYPADDYHQDFYKKNPLRYGAYRKGCGRDARVAELWGDRAAFAHTH